MVLLKEFLEKGDFFWGGGGAGGISRQKKCVENYPVGKELREYRRTREWCKEIDDDDDTVSPAKWEPGPGRERRVRVRA